MGAQKSAGPWLRRYGCARGIGTGGSDLLRLFDVLKNLISLGDEIGDRGFVHPNANLVGDFDVGDIVADFGDHAIDAATDHHPIATFQILQHLAVLALFFLLGTNQEKIEDGEHQNKGDQHVQ